MYNTYEVLANGLSVSRARVNILASNIANAQTTRTQDGTPYKRKDLVVAGRSMQSSFATSLDKQSLEKPVILGVVEDNSTPNLVYEPQHPDANDEGYVAYPNINIVSTMTDLMTASRLYEANVTAIETTRRIMAEGLKIGVGA